MAEKKSQTPTEIKGSPPFFLTALLAVFDDGKKSKIVAETNEASESVVCLFSLSWQIHALDHSKPHVLYVHTERLFDRSASQPTDKLANKSTSSQRVERLAFLNASHQRNTNNI